jgi:hypothetical protein
MIKMRAVVMADTPLLGLFEKYCAGSGRKYGGNWPAPRALSRV